MSNDTQTPNSRKRLILSAIDPLFSILGLIIGLGIGVFVGMSTNPDIAMPPTPLATPTFDAARYEHVCGYTIAYIVIAVEDIPAGSIIDQNMIWAYDLPADLVVETMVAGGDWEQAIMQAVGQRARIDIEWGTVLTMGLLEQP